MYADDRQLATHATDAAFTGRTTYATPCGTHATRSANRLVWRCDARRSNRRATQQPTRDATTWPRDGSLPRGGRAQGNGEVPLHSLVATQSVPPPVAACVRMAARSTRRGTSFSRGHAIEPFKYVSSRICCIAYMSHQMVGTAIQPHGDVFAMAISLDHSIYFHRQLDPTQVGWGGARGAEGTRRGEARRGKVSRREEADSCSSVEQ